MPLAWRLALRELRGGVRGLRIVLACLALGVAAIAAVGLLRDGVEHGLDSDGREILGGDLEIDGGSQPLPADLHQWLLDRGARLSDVVTTRSMVVVPGGPRMLVELKAVDAAWPLVGTAVMDPPGTAIAAVPTQVAPQRDGRFGLVAEPLVLERLGLKQGDSVRIGDLTFDVRGTLLVEPDRVATPSLLGPRVLIPLAALPATHLMQPGAIAEHRLRIVLPADLSVPQVVEELRAAFPETGWRYRDTSEAAPGVGRLVRQTGLFMTLVGLTALLVGGIGVANGVRAWLDARAGTVAILRCLGAAPSLVFRICLIQVGLLSVLGVVIGLAGGVLLTIVAFPLLASVLPVAPRLGVFAGPLALAAAYGLLTALAFALWPLARALRISGGALFRDAVLPQPGRPPAALIAANAAVVAALVALIVLPAANRGFALGFCGAALATLAVFRAAAWGVTTLAARLPVPHAAWGRLGLANLHRPGTAAPLMLVSVGLGLATLAAVALTEVSLRRQVEDEVPADAPSFFFIDIQSAELAPFRRLVESLQGVSRFDEVPSLRARMVAVDGVPAERVKATPDTAWALKGDRGLTYAGTMPTGTRLVAGQWWPAGYQGPPLVSLDADLAGGWGVHVGSVLRVNVLGRDIDLRVASLREVEWRRMGLNFTLVASPGLLSHAPHTHIATIAARPQVQAHVLQTVTDTFPNVSAIRVADVMHTVGELMGKVAAALAASAAVALAAGVLVLAGAVASGQRRRVQEAVILKTLGASRAQVRAAWLTEFGVLGLAAGLVAAGIGTLASWALMRLVMESDWSFAPLTLAGTVAGALALLLAVGYAGTAAALRAKPAPLLRND